ncbi:glycerophosphodiester phosphodiesterase [Sulfolobus sp. S-194]|uniref:glycerophosphodiester phosphodiesterase n=1 Tax=Sulfolobus sp. S-194 TaxID=2512240 RepID=UPI001436E547|nr:glycerophosphodiester phosphodiesterase family protein [Sulfolobus sp. S-194]QIW23530.1 glycerophosphodiester phosphodiesterase [Sulfolobus sp. S-194]
MICIGHRGASAYEPENTIRAFKRAIEMGCEGIEMDLRRTKDGKIIVIHDETVDRTTNGKGKVSEMTLEEIKKLDSRGEKIPLLSEVLSEVKANLYLLEIKEGGYEEQIVNEVKGFNLLDSVIFISFNYDSLRKIKESGGKRIGLIYSSLPSPIKIAKNMNAYAMLPKYNLLNRTEVHELKRNKFFLIPWVVNDVSILEKMVYYRVDAIATDKPDIMKQLKIILSKK